MRKNLDIKLDRIYKHQYIGESALNLVLEKNK